jgi:hypothetical protein
MTTDRLPRYRVLTGPDDAAFCYRVSEALDLGYQLYGSPALTVNDGTTIVAQALLWPGNDQPPPPPPASAPAPAPGSPPPPAPAPAPPRP